MNMASAKLRSLPGLERQIKKRANPIKKYKKVQVGPNTQLGGLKDGFTKVEYQLPISGIVKIEPIRPAARGITIQIMSGMISFFLIVVISVS